MKQAAKTSVLPGGHVVPDVARAGMWRVRFPDGRLTEDGELEPGQGCGHRHRIWHVPSSRTSGAKLARTPPVPFRPKPCHHYQRRPNAVAASGSGDKTGIDAHANSAFQTCLPLPQAKGRKEIGRNQHPRTGLHSDDCPRRWGWVVCEGGEGISKPFADRAEAEWWLEQHRRWHQPYCCVCHSAVTRPDDPWEVISVSTSSGADWMHKSCMEKFGSWADDERRRPDREPGPHLIPNMEVLDSAWRKKLR
jgi:hypothetical protein